MSDSVDTATLSGPTVPGSYVDDPALKDALIVFLTDDRDLVKLLYGDCDEECAVVLSNLAREGDIWLFAVSGNGSAEGAAVTYS